MDYIKLKKILLKTPFWIFCTFMIFSYYKGLMYPEQTNYWLVKNGVPIMLLEFLSIFSVILLLPTSLIEKHMLIKEAGLLANKKIGRWIFLIAIMCMAFFVTFIYNILLFFYFLLSNTVKYLAFIQIKTSKEGNETMKSFGVMVISVVLSFLLAFVFSFFINSIFSHQLYLLNQFEEDVFQKSGVVGGSNLGFFAIWRFTTFLFC